MKTVPHHQTHLAAGLVSTMRSFGGCWGTLWLACTAWWTSTLASALSNIWLQVVQCSVCIICLCCSCSLSHVRPVNHQPDRCHPHCPQLGWPCPRHRARPWRPSRQRGRRTAVRVLVHHGGGVRGGPDPGAAHATDGTFENGGRGEKVRRWCCKRDPWCSLHAVVSHVHRHVAQFSDANFRQRFAQAMWPLLQRGTRGTRGQ